MSHIVEEIFEAFDKRGTGAYFGEEVTQSEHALQAAHLAESAGAPEALIAAALLHDVGHLIHGLHERIADEGVDARHEEVGGAWLAERFAPDVTEPVRLHVAAKRYLSATDSAYAALLSPASQQSLALQGGPFSAEECAEFERNRYFAEACRLRRWDDEAKIPGLDVPDLEHYRLLLETVAARPAFREL
jgi:gamma-butyrobetaine dioxygenase